MNGVLGIDIGSASSKGVVLADGAEAASFVCPSGGGFRLTAERIKTTLLERAGMSPEDIAWTIATGYGSKQVPFADEMKSDLSCHARGIFAQCPTVRTLIDVGDLYSKVVRLDGNGNVSSFLLSGKCAGGSGRILQVIARVLQVKVEEIGELSLKSRKRVDFNTGCVVFAESEAVSRISEGIAKEDLLAGIHRALAAQINSLADRLKVEMDLALVGGGARDEGLVHALEEIRDHEIIVPPEPHLTAALGAALFAEEKTASRAQVHVG